MPDIYLLIDGQQQGPYTEDQVRQSVAEGLIPADLPAWHDGLTQWIEIQGLLEHHQGAGIEAEPTNCRGKEDIQRSETGHCSAPLLDVTALPDEEPKRAKPILGKVGVGVVFGVGFGLLLLALVAGIVLGLVILHRSTAKTVDVATTIVPLPLSNDNSASTPKVTDVQSWLKQKIEGSGIKIEYQHDRHDNHVTRFSHVSFDAGAISYDEETRYFRNDSGLGFSLSHTDSDHREIDLSKIQPNSFRLSEQAQAADETEDGKPRSSYSIDCVPNNLSPVLYFEDKDAAIRVIKALNFLSQHVDHPPAKSEPF